MTIRISTKELWYKLKYLAIYIVSIAIVYIFSISPLFSYAKLTLNISYSKLMISIGLIILTVLFFPTDKDKPSTYLYTILYSVTFIPLCCYYWLNDQNTLYILMEAFAFLVLALVQKYNGRGFIIRQANLSTIIKLLFLIYVLSVVLLVFQNGGIKLNAVIADVYSVRNENNISGIGGYLINWCAKSFMPFFFIYFITKKNYFAVAFVCILQLSLFLSFGFKSFLMAILMLIMVNFLMKNPSDLFRKFLLILSGCNFLAYITEKLGITTLIMQLIPYRTLFIPAQGQYEYYTFFTNNEYLHFSEGIIGRILGIEYPYGDQIGRVVNQYIYGASKISNGNTGVFSYGFADWGFIGMVAAAIVIGIIFIIVDSSTKKLPIAIPVSAMAYQMFIMNDSSLLISLNTGGILWTVLLLIFLNYMYSDLKIEGNRKSVIKDKNY